MDAHDWDDRYAAAELVWSVEPNQFVAREELTDLPAGRAVDLAAGEGRNAIWLARRGWDVTAVDFSQVALDKGRRLASEQRLAGRCAGSAPTRPPGRPTGRYDLAVVAYLQLPAEQRRAAVRRAFDALRPGGTFLLVAHDSTNLTEGTGGPQDPAVLMTAEDVLADLGDRSFEVVRAERVARTVERRARRASRPAPPGTAWCGWCAGLSGCRFTAGRLAGSARRRLVVVGRLRRARRARRRTGRAGSPGPRRGRVVAVDPGVLGGLRLAQLLDQAEPEQHHGEDQQHEDREGGPSGLDVLRLRRRRR